MHGWALWLGIQSIWVSCVGINPNCTQVASSGISTDTRCVHMWARRHKHTHTHINPTAPWDHTWSCAALKSPKTFKLSWRCLSSRDLFAETLSWPEHHASAGQSDCNVNYCNDKVLFWSVADGFHLGLFCFSYLTSSHLLACIFLHPVSQKHFHFCSCDIVITAYHKHHQSQISSLTAEAANLTLNLP